MNAELIVNLWAIYDSGSGVVYALSGRVYAASGTDAEKLTLLRRLSATDYLTAKRYPLPDRFQVNYTDGTVRHKVTTLSAVMDSNWELFDELFKNIESELPPIPDFSDARVRAVSSKLPNDPLCVVTVLYEDDAGNIRPIITDDDRTWVAAREEAHGRSGIGI